MKALIFLPFLLFATAFAEPAAPAAPEKPKAAEKVIAKYPKLETKERYKFFDVEVLEKLPDGVFVKYGRGEEPDTDETIWKHGGITFLPYESLPDAVRRQVGGFTASEARKFRAKRIADEEVGNFHPLITGKDFLPFDPKLDK